MAEMAVAEVVVASRFHNVLGGLLVGRPTVSLSYARRTRSCSPTFGLDGFDLPMTAFDADAVIAQVDRAATLGAEKTGSMRRIAEGYCRQVNEELDDVLALLGRARVTPGSARRWVAATAASTQVLSSAPPTTSVNQWAACKQQAHGPSRDLEQGHDRPRPPPPRADDEEATTEGGEHDAPVPRRVAAAEVGDLAVRVGPTDDQLAEQPPGPRWAAAPAGRPARAPTTCAATPRPPRRPGGSARPASA